MAQNRTAINTQLTSLYMALVYKHDVFVKGQKLNEDEIKGLILGLEWQAYGEADNHIEIVDHIDESYGTKAWVAKVAGQTKKAAKSEG